MSKDIKKRTIISAVAINSLIEALTHVYWYKSELRSFLTNTLSRPEILSRINWEDYKRNIVSKLIDFLARNQDQYQNDLLRLMREVCSFEDYSHLEKLESGKEKSEKARKAVEALKKVYNPHQEIVDEQKIIEKRRKKAYQMLLQRQSVSKELEELKKLIFQLLDEDVTPQKRGYSLESLLRRLFGVFDLDPKASFKVVGEQIDGAFTFDKTDYLLEAKWQQKPVVVKELDAFNGKITRRLDNTLGLFISMGGFSADAIQAHSSSRPTMILMDGSDLMAVLEGRIDLIQLLLRKRRHASQTGEIYLPIHKFYEN